VLREVRGTLQMAALPVLILSGRGEADGRDAIRHGANEYLSKPLSATVLLRVVSALLREAGSGAGGAANPSVTDPVLPGEVHEIR
jgi:DNA-binding response OmpR family regulator